MKTYTVQFLLSEGSDEFWEANPKPEEVIKFIIQDLNQTFCLSYLTDNFKIIKIVDDTVYEEYEEDGNDQIVIDKIIDNSINNLTKEEEE